MRVTHQSQGSPELAPPRTAWAVLAAGGRGMVTTGSPVRATGRYWTLSARHAPLAMTPRESQGVPGSPELAPPRTAWAVLPARDMILGDN